MRYAGWFFALAVMGIFAFFVGRSTVPTGGALIQPAPAIAAEIDPQIQPVNPPVVAPAALVPPREKPPAPPDFTVKVVKIERGTAYENKGPFGGPTIYESPCLYIFFEMANESETRKYDSHGWPTGHLTDEHGNVYRLLSDNHIARPDKIPDVLRPGEKLRDVLVFEQPLPQAKMLTLELQDHFSSATGFPRSSVEIKIPLD